MSSESLPSDYESCGDCGYDHAYEQDEAVKAHGRLGYNQTMNKATLTAKAMKLAQSIAESKELACDSSDLHPSVDAMGSVLLGAEENVYAPKLPGERHGRPLGRVVYVIEVTARWIPYDEDE